MQFEFLLVFIFFKFAMTRNCETNFTDQILKDSTRVYLKKLQRENKGTFKGNCPLIKPNPAVSLECDKCAFGARLSRAACIAADYPGDKVPSTYIYLETNTSKTDIEILGGMKSKKYSKISPNDVYGLPFSTIYTTVKNYQIRDINEKGRTITMDMSLSMMWADSRIFSHEPKTSTLSIEEEGFEVYQGARGTIWKPHLTITNLSDYKAFGDSIHLTGLKTIRSNYFEEKFCIRGPMLKYELEAKISFYCDFDLTHYPIDSSFCQLRMGGESSNMAFKWKMGTKKNENFRSFHISDIVADVSLADVKNVISTNTKIGFDIRVTRSLKPYILKYYIPCIAIVVMSQLSFLIPLDSLPGRVGLVVTQFLTLMSLFIQQMVNHQYYSLLSLPMTSRYRPYIFGNPQGASYSYLSCSCLCNFVHFRMIHLRVQVLTILEYTF